jgi:hypothetical protein
MVLQRHLLEVHRNGAAPELDGPTAWDAHFHEHNGPSGLRNHEHDPAEPILMMTASLDRELFPSEYVANQVGARMKTQPVITDWRDGVMRACDDFDPQSVDAVPLGPGRIFTQFHDIDGAHVRVVLSSAAMRECCRVFIKPAEDDFSYVKALDGSLQKRPMAPTDLHLCRCMAAELRRALDEAFDYTLDAQSVCCNKVNPDDAQ